MSKRELMSTLGFKRVSIVGKPDIGSENMWIHVITVTSACCEAQVIQICNRSIL